MNNGQMGRGNENPTQYLLDDWGKPRKKLQSGFEPGTSRMRLVRYHGATSLGDYNFMI